MQTDQPASTAAYPHMRASSPPPNDTRAFLGHPVLARKGILAGVSCFVMAIVLAPCIALGVFAVGAATYVRSMVQNEPLQVPLPIDPTKPAIQEGELGETVQILQGQTAQIGRLKIKLVIAYDAFAGLMINVPNSATDHYIQVPEGWKEDVDRYQIELVKVGQVDGEPCAWVRATASGDFID